MAHAPYKAIPKFKSKMEQDYWWHLEARRQDEEIQAYCYEAFSVCVGHDEKGHRRMYTPDFLVILDNGEIEFHETKGSKNARGQQTAMQRLYAAHELYGHFRWVFVERKRDGFWRLLRVGDGE